MATKVKVGVMRDYTKGLLGHGLKKVMSKKKKNDSGDSTPENEVETPLAASLLKSKGPLRDKEVAKQGKFILKQLKSGIIENMPNRIKIHDPKSEAKGAGTPNVSKPNSPDRPNLIDLMKNAKEPQMPSRGGSMPPKMSQFILPNLATVNPSAPPIVSPVQDNMDQTLGQAPAVCDPSTTEQIMELITEIEEMY